MASLLKEFFIYKENKKNLFKLLFHIMLQSEVLAVIWNIKCNWNIPLVKIDVSMLLDLINNVYENLNDQIYII